MARWTLPDIHLGLRYRQEFCVINIRINLRTNSQLAIITWPTLPYTSILWLWHQQVIGTSNTSLSGYGPQGWHWNRSCRWPAKNVTIKQQQHTCCIAALQYLHRLLAKFHPKIVTNENATIYNMPADKQCKSYWVTCWCSSIAERCSPPTYPRYLLAPNYQLLYTSQRLQLNISTCAKEDVLDQQIIFVWCMLHYTRLTRVTKYWQQLQPMNFLN